MKTKFRKVPTSRWVVHLSVYPLIIIEVIDNQAILLTARAHYSYYFLLDKQFISFNNRIKAHHFFTTHWLLGSAVIRIESPQYGNVFHIQ